MYHFIDILYTKLAIIYKSESQQQREAEDKANAKAEKLIRKKYREVKSKVLAGCKAGNVRAMWLQLDFLQNNPNHIHRLPEELDLNDVIAAYKEALSEYDDLIQKRIQQ